DPRFAHLRWVEVGEPGRVGEVIERLVEAVLAQSQ
ncbi:TPA: toxin, partial [Pseudomonas aeruginosa]|nr:toxin [Pseudomonas aeruginosa]